MYLMSSSEPGLMGTLARSSAPLPTTTMILIPPGLLIFRDIFCLRWLKLNGMNIPRGTFCSHQENSPATTTQTAHNQPPLSRVAIGPAAPARSGEHTPALP